MMGEKKEEAYGLAIDIGTTNIKFAKVSLEREEVIATGSRRNSQGLFGKDVMSRIQFACQGNRKEFTELVRRDIKRGMQELQAEAPERIAISGNVTMLALLLGDSLEGMQEYPFCPERLILPAMNQVFFVPAAGAFIGGDVVAGASLLVKKSAPWMLIDLGTNGEMVFYDGSKRTAVSVAAGPAFEQMLGKDGSVALEVLAQAYKKGLVDETGLLLAEESENNGLEQGIIRELQLAKAAVRTGIEYLLEEAKQRQKQTILPKQVYLAGGMGVVTEEACLLLGMLPEEFRGKCQFLGNSSLQGAIALLLHPEQLPELQLLAESIEEHTLALWSEFNQRFIEHINLPL